jgi:hypothetical protein
LRYIARKTGVTVHPHLFRHTLAQGVLDTTGNIKVAQEILGHAYLSRTADLYMRVDQHAMAAFAGALRCSPVTSTRRTAAANDEIILSNSLKNWYFQSTDHEATVKDRTGC